MKKILFYIFLCLIIECSNFVLAQQTIFNVPSADVTPKGKIYLEHESQFRAWNPNAFWVGTHYSGYGIGHNTEIDMTLFNVGAPATNNVSLGTGFKSVMPIAGLKDKYPKQEYKFTLGSQVLSGLQGQGAGNWTYAHFSGRLPVTRTRITSGMSFGTKQIFGENTTCFIGGIEQPVNQKINIIADWYSGTEHFAGFFIPGFSYSMPKDTTLFVGYQIPNSSKNGPSGFVIELAKIF